MSVKVDSILYSNIELKDGGRVFITEINANISSSRFMKWFMDDEDSTCFKKVDEKGRVINLSKYEIRNVSQYEKKTFFENITYKYFNLPSTYMSLRNIFKTYIELLILLAGIVLLAKGPEALIQTYMVGIIFQASAMLTLLMALASLLLGIINLARLGFDFHYTFKSEGVYTSYNLISLMTGIFVLFFIFNVL